MLINQLTQPITKKWLFSLLLVTIGADIALFLSRDSYFMEIIYSNILLFSLFVAVKLAPRLRDGNAGPMPKRKLFSSFVKAFVLLYLLGSLNDYYISQTFSDFTEDRSLIAEDFSQKVDSFQENTAESETDDKWSDRIFEWLDTIGYDFYNYFLAGLEEVWRLSYIVLFLLFFKKITPVGLWERSSKEGYLIAAVVLSSLLFGVGHSLSYEMDWSVFIGTVVSYTNMGLILGYLLIRTRNLWLLIIAHGLYNVMTTMGWSYYEWTPEVFVGLLLLANLVAWLISKIRRKGSVVSEGVEV
jgi:membrane protease YdiL (CAAX protease family)